MTVTHSGDLGDLIYFCAVLAELPGPHTVLLFDCGRTKGIVKRESVITPLLLAQDYIAAVRIMSPGEHADWRAEQFRGSGTYAENQTVVNAHAEHGVKVAKIPRAKYGQRKWLRAGAEPNDRVIVNRTARYNNPYFPWRRVVEKYGKLILFVGLPEEHQTFCAKFGEVEYRKTDNLLQVAQLIAGSLLFIGNQSSCGAISEGLKHRHIQETSPAHADCIFIRDNVQHVYDGACILPGFNGEDNSVEEEFAGNVDGMGTLYAPPDNWQLDGLTSHSYSCLVDGLRRNEKWKHASDIEIKRAILRATLKRCPGWGRNPSHLHVPKTAIEIAKSFA